MSRYVQKENYFICFYIYGVYGTTRGQDHNEYNIGVHRLIIGFY